tara:strand:- start:7227 stop:7502 length:276 start_codon:yes stop_codon:yes gene_type:complete
MGKKQTKKQQANMQTDALETSGWSEGLTFAGQDNGTFTMDPLEVNYELGQMTFDYEDETLRKKYPALQDAYQHYQNIKQLCQTREKEEHEN